MMTHQQAQAKGVRLLARIAETFRGGGFKLMVWENFGWHYSVENNFLDVSAGCNGEGPCMVLFKPHYERCGTVQRHEDPVVAIRRAVRVLEDNLREHQLFLDGVKASLSNREKP